MGNPVTPESSPSPYRASGEGQLGQTPFLWRVSIAGSILLIAETAFLLRETIGLRGQAIAGVFFFFGFVALFSSNLRAVNWRTICCGLGLQLLLALLVLKGNFVLNGRSYSVKNGLERVGEVFKAFVGF
jgi:hypothetical protein